MMEFDDDHEEEEEEEEDYDDYDDDDIAITPISFNSSGSGRYRECLKNHAVSMGGYAVDGCGEFMPAGGDGTLHALTCAACNCHRNFHRKEILLQPSNPQNQLVIYNYNSTTTPSCRPHFHQFYPYNHRPSGSGLGPLGLPSPTPPQKMTSGGRKKRHRTKFTQEQKEKMVELAEKLEWKIHKEDDTAVLNFCDETGLKRHVLRVWMHNNKHTLGKKHHKP